MSMYTELLDAAFGQRAPVLVHPTETDALSAVRRCRCALDQDMPPRTDPDAVPVVLAREIGYDVALLELAGLLGIATDPSRFEQPRHERARLEEAFRERGVTLDPNSGAQETQASRS
jgi:hypothetical protein